MSKKILYTNGCSWTAGNGIEFDPTLNHLPAAERASNMRTKNWSSVLGAMLGYDVINESQGAGSNRRMVRTTCDYIQSLDKEIHKDLLVVLGWSTVDRNELLLDDGNNYQWCMFNATQKISEHHPKLNNYFLKIVDDIQEKYMKYIMNSRMSYTYFFQEMYLMSNLLENLNIRYIFFSSLPWRKYATDTTRNVEEEFAMQISHLKRPNILNTRDCDDKLNVMSDFCRLNNVPMAPNHHTMIMGHKLWAEHLYKEIRNVYYD